MNEEVISSVVEIALSGFSESQLLKNPEKRQKLAWQIREYILGKIPYSTLQMFTENLVGTWQPLEHLREIMEIGSEPIPEFKEQANENENETKREKSRPWSNYEDQRLIAGIMRYGLDNWTSISRFVGNSRTRAQCSQRWTRGLDPKISKAQWTQQEENALMQLIQIHGNKAWTIISVHMRNRSDVQCRYKYKQLLKEKRIKLNEPLHQEPPHLPPQNQPVYFQPPPAYQYQPQMLPYAHSNELRIPQQPPQPYMMPYVPQPSYPTTPSAQTIQTQPLPSQPPQQHTEPKIVPAEHHKIQQSHPTVTTTIHQPPPAKHITKSTVATGLPSIQPQAPASRTVEQSVQPPPQSHFIPLAQSPLYNIVPTLPPMEPNSTQLPHVQNVFSFASPLVGSPLTRGNEYERKETTQQAEHVEVIRHEHTTAPDIAAPAFNAKLYSVY